MADVDIAFHDNATSGDHQCLCGQGDRSDAGSFFFAQRPAYVDSYHQAKASCNLCQVTSLPHNLAKHWFGLCIGQHVDNCRSRVQKLSTLFHDPDFSDITLVVGHRSYYAHKLILCITSDVFRVMLTSSQWREACKNRIVLKEEPECIKVFEDFLKYLYTGQIHLTHESVLPLLTLADKYNISDLTQVCTGFMCEHFVSTLAENRAISWLQYALVCGHKEVQKVCSDFIIWNFQKVMACADFKFMDVETYIAFLQSSHLVVYNEYTLYLGVKKWLYYREQSVGNDFTSLQNIALPILSHIRFPMILPKQLTAMQSDPMVIKFKNFFSEKIQNALDFHSLSLEERLNVSSVSGHNDMYMPRNYTCEMWSTNLTIGHFSEIKDSSARAAFFSTPLSGSIAEENRNWDWHVDLYLKGVCFQRSMLIGLWESLEISEVNYRTVRLAVKSDTTEKRVVEISVLATGYQDGIECVKNVVHRKLLFDEDNHLHNINDIVPYDELNCPNSPYLGGCERNEFSITIIIKPVHV